MVSKPLLKEFFLAALITAILHFLALKTSLYWTTDWFDILMHFLGGVTAGLGVFFFFLSFKVFNLHNISRLLLLCFIISATLVIGLSWELWEIFVQFTDITTDLPDTLLDIVMDTVGAICAYIIGGKYLTARNYELS